MKQTIIGILILAGTFAFVFGPKTTEKYQTSEVNSEVQKEESVVKVLPKPEAVSEKLDVPSEEELEERFENLRLKELEREFERLTVVSDELVKLAKQGPLSPENEQKMLLTLRTEAVLTQLIFDHQMEELEAL